MFGESIDKTAAALPLPNSFTTQGIGSATSTQQPEFGVSSAISDLIAEIKQVYNNSYDLKSTLGIATPPEKQGENGPGESLVGALRLAAITVAKTNLHLADCLRHLRS